MGDKNKKKLTKKEQKALNHASLMSHKKGSGPASANTGQPNNVIQVQFGGANKDKKAA